MILSTLSQNLSLQAIVHGIVQESHALVRVRQVNVTATVLHAKRP